MGVTTTQTNKPLNPRGNDQSPLAYNRAKLFSGKALDFDGVNDTLSTDYAPSSNIQTTAYWVKLDSLTTDYSLGGFVNGTTDAFILFYWGGQSDKYFGFNTWNNDSYGIILPDFVDDWFHIVAEYNFSDFTQSKIFVNGQELNISQTKATSVQRTTANRTFDINTPTGSFLTNGKINGVKVFNTALTAAQVADLYNNPEKVVPTGVDNTALKLWLPMQEGAGTTAINGAPDAIGSDLITNGDFATDSKWTKGTGWSIGSGVASCDGTQTGNSTLVQQNGVQGVSLSIEDGELYKLSFDTSNITAGALTYFEVGGGIEYTDISTNGSHNIYIKATATNNRLTIAANSVFVGSVDNVTLNKISNTGAISGATWAHGIGAPVAQTAVIDWNKKRVNNTDDVLIPQGLTSGRDLLGNLFENVRKQGALNLDGNSWAEVHDNESLDMTTTATLEAWVNADGLDGGYDIIMVKSSATFWTGNYGRYTLRANNAAVNWWFDDFTANSKYHNVALSGWNHLVVTKDGTEEKLYVNGVLASTQTGAATFTASPYSLLIGVNSSKTENWTKPIAQPRIYNRALTAEEVQRNYNAGKNIYTNS